MTEKIMPVVMLKPKTQAKMPRYTGNPSEKSEKRTSIICDIIRYPTKIKAGAVALAGINRNTGEKNNAIKNNNAVAIFAKPVLAPAAAPTPLSTYAVAGESENIADITPAKESDI